MSIILLLIYSILSCATLTYSMLITSDIPINYTMRELSILYMLSVLAIIFLVLLMRHTKVTLLKITNYILTFTIIFINIINLVTNLALKLVDKPIIIYEVLYITTLIIVLKITSSLDCKESRYGTLKR